MILFHYTTAERAAMIRSLGLLLPHEQELLDGRAAVWLSGVSHPGRKCVRTRRALGLDHEKYEQDRTEAEISVVVDPDRDGVHPWWSVALDYPGAWAATVAPLGSRPDTWWVAFEYIKIPTERSAA